MTNKVLFVLFRKTFTYFDSFYLTSVSRKGVCSKVVSQTMSRTWNRISGSQSNIDRPSRIARK